MPLTGALTALPAPLTLPYEPCNNGLYKMNLIGNPYPSVLDADTFLTNPANQSALDGAVYLWSHNSGPSNANPGNGTQVYNYTVSDYLIYNLVGGIGTGKYIGDAVYAPNESNRPIGKIAMCQGFFVRGLSSGQATFSPDMQDTSPALSDPANQQFYRTAGTGMVPAVSKSRFWLSLSDLSQSLYHELLIGYMPSRTIAAAPPYTAQYVIPAALNTYDKMYDTELYKTVYNTTAEVNNRIEFYSMINASNPCPRLAIQGRTLNSPFNINDVVPLGFSCPPGNYTISTQNPTNEGIFGTQNYWLREDLGGNNYIFHNIKTTPFSFYTLTAIADNVTRFQIVFKLPPVDSLNSTTCNSTLPLITSILGSTGQPSDSGHGYRWQFTDITANTIYFTVNTGPSNLYFNNPMIPLGFIDFNSTYYIRVGVFNDSLNAWIYSETPCAVTTPPRIITNNQSNLTCGGSTKIIRGTQVTCSANAPFSYRWRVTSPSGSVTFDTTAPSFYFNNNSTGPAAIQANPTFIANNTQYCVDVQILYQTSPLILGAFGPSPPCCYNTGTLRMAESASFDTKDIAVTDFDAYAFPNPFQDNFTIKIDTGSQENATVEVYDMLGKLLEQHTINATTDFSGHCGNKLAAGFYNIIITQGQNRKALKMLKN